MTKRIDGATTRTAEERIRQELRAATWTRELADLLQRRPELAGVYGPADLTAESVRWCA